MAASPLLNIIGRNPVLSMPLLQRINNQNLEVIQGLKEENHHPYQLLLLLFRVLRRQRAAREVQQVVDKFQMTEDSHTSKGGVVNTVEE